MISRKPYIQLIVLCFLAFIGCKADPKNADPPPSATTQPKTTPFSVQFVNITKQAGITFIHNNGAFGKKLLPESMGSGCAFLDYNNDGWQDILLINSMDWPSNRRKTTYSALYKNNQNGTFTDVTQKAGLAVETYGMGTTIGDYDNDGDSDIYISSLGPDLLFRNNSDGTFSDVTKQAGLGSPDFGTSSTWFDYDKDGNLDLFVTNYVQWSIETDLFCTLDGTNKSYCTPESYKGASSRLYRNKGNGTFEDTTKAAGLLDPVSKALGVVVLDYDLDHWPDLFVANDTQPNKLYHNNKNGTFRETGVLAGVAYSETGIPRAGMGVDAADFDDSGYPSLIIGNFSNEMMALYHNEGTGLFIDEAPATTVGQATLLKLTFGAFFFDFDLDGNLDIFGANGHVHDDINVVQQQVTYAQPPHLFRNLGKKHFEEVSRKVGKDFQQPVVARGAAYGDIDNDGDLDVLISTNSGPAVLFRNDGGNKNNYIRFKTVGSKSNRDGVGAKIVINLNDGIKKWQQVKSASSYCSQNESIVTFGLGSDKQIKRVAVTWPSGSSQTLENVNANQLVVLSEK
jgi:hypothetical protein